MSTADVLLLAEAGGGPVSLNVKEKEDVVKIFCQVATWMG